MTGSGGGILQKQQQSNPMVISADIHNPPAQHRSQLWRPQQLPIQPQVSTSLSLVNVNVGQYSAASTRQQHPAVSSSPVNQHCQQQQQQQQQQPQQQFVTVFLVSNMEVSAVTNAVIAALTFRQHGGLAAVVRPQHHSPTKWRRSPATTTSASIYLLALRL